VLGKRVCWPLHGGRRRGHEIAAVVVRDCIGRRGRRAGGGRERPAACVGRRKETKKRKRKEKKRKGGFSFAQKFKKA